MLQAIICVCLASPTNEKHFLIAKTFIIHHFTLKEFKPASALMCYVKFGGTCQWQLEAVLVRIDGSVGRALMPPVM